MGLSLFRGEIGPRPVAPPVAPTSGEADVGQEGAATAEAPAPNGLREKAQSLARLMGPAGLLMAGMLLVLIVGSLLIDWLA